MFMDEFDKLSEKLNKVGRNLKVPENIANKIRGLYGSRFALSAKKSSEVVLELCEEFPECNIPEVLRPTMSHSRK